MKSEKSVAEVQAFVTIESGKIGSGIDRDRNKEDKKGKRKTKKKKEAARSLSDKIIRETSINPFDERSADLSFGSHGRTAVSSLVTQELIHGGWNTFVGVGRVCKNSKLKNESTRLPVSSMLYNTVYFEAFVEIIASIWRNSVYSVYIQRRSLKSRQKPIFALSSCVGSNRLSHDAIFLLACKRKWRIPGFKRSSVTRLITVAITSQAMNRGSLLDRVKSCGRPRSRNPSLSPGKHLNRDNDGDGDDDGECGLQAQGCRDGLSAEPLNVLSINERRGATTMCGVTKISRLFTCIEVMFLHFPYFFRNLRASLNNDKVNLKFAKPLNFLSVNKRSLIHVSHTQFCNTTNLTIKNANNVSNINNKFKSTWNEVSVILAEDLLLAAGDFCTGTTSNVNAVDLSPRSTNPMPRGVFFSENIVKHGRIHKSSMVLELIRSVLQVTGNYGDILSDKVIRNLSGSEEIGQIKHSDHILKKSIPMCCTQLSLGRQPPRNHEQVLIANQLWTAKRWTRQVDASKRIVDSSIDNNSGGN
ncbi:hypothetical protein G5I_06612 [Acromyrmex echinatior]|uniref:Uncharacterized protein n=1 Tax=Acromyrmex echinatior TaxID=103372 RepID=F4WLI5_ACREC|nr:hypothetical protein G5I_06612 [Acromyrmex echinatior]